MDVTALDGRSYAKFVVAGAYFLRKYRRVLDDLNVFPVPDGDTGTNMYLTARQAALEAGKARHGSLAEVAAAAAQGSLMGARGNSGVIVSQMLRGFAHHVRHRRQIDTFVLATGMREAVQAAKQALVTPVDGTILSVAEAAAEAAYHMALHEGDFYRLCSSIVRAANEALERTPEQLPALREAGVVDSGGAGFVYFFEGILRFLPDVKVRSTAFPRRPVRERVFTASQQVGRHRFCTEFLLGQAPVAAAELREVLQPRGESLIVAGTQPTFKVHIHTDDPDGVARAAGKHGEVSRLKIDDMERQHRLLLVKPPALAYSLAVLLPGRGFERIAKELGAEVTLVRRGLPDPRDLLLAVNACLSERVYLLLDDPAAEPAAREAAARTAKAVDVVPAPDVVGAIAALFALRAGESAAPERERLGAAVARVRSARVCFAGKDAAPGGTTGVRGKAVAAAGARRFTGETLVEAAREALAAMGAEHGGLITVYYGGAQRERDAQRTSEDLRAFFTHAEVEYYFGGQEDAELWISLE